MGRTSEAAAARPPEPFVHVDLDAFYASVEVHKNPELKGLPVVVGGIGGRGVVSAASYEARKFGIHSAMPVVRARRLCPDAVFLSPDFTSYRTYSNAFRDILLSYTPLVEPLSLDEAFMDVGGSTMLFGAPIQIGADIRKRVEDELGITCSAGVAPNKFLAKLASEEAKPNGLRHVPADGVQAFLDPLPVRALWGAGAKTVETLSKLAVRTVADLRETPESVLARVLGDNQAAHLKSLSIGADERPVVPYEVPKSVSHEETFDEDLDDDDQLLRELLLLSRKVGSRLRKGGYRARTVTLKVRLASFSTLTRSRTLADPTDVGPDIYGVIAELYRALPGERRRVRLLGVSATGLLSAGTEQLALLRGVRWGDVDRTVDRIEARFGTDAAMPASLLERQYDLKDRRPSAGRPPSPPGPDGPTHTSGS